MVQHLWLENNLTERHLANSIWPPTDLRLQFSLQAPLYCVCQTMFVNQMFINQMFVDQMSVDQMSVDQMSVDQMSVDKMSVDKMSVD
jgi:pentapeptide MXKDX repeat protein